MFRKVNVVYRLVYSVKQGYLATTGLKTNVMFLRLSIVARLQLFYEQQANERENLFYWMLLPSIVILSKNHYAIKPISIFQKQCRKRGGTHASRALATLSVLE